jgi:uncharacterized protein (DUF885 family)
MVDRASDSPPPDGDPAELARLADEAWEIVIAAEPLFATQLGDRRFDDRLPPVTSIERALVIERSERLLEAARAMAERSWPADSDRVTAAALVSFLDTDLARRRAAVETWAADPLDGPQVAFLGVPDYHVVRTPTEGEAMVARWRAMGFWLDAHAANVRESAVEGRVSPVSPIRKVIEQLDDLLSRPDDDWPLLAPARADRPDWSAAERSAFADGIADAVRDGVRPAFERYRTLLADEILPRARPDDRPGLADVPGGGEAYELLSRSHTTLDLEPETIHRIGLDEVAGIDAELESLGGPVLGVTTRTAAVHRLRSDPALQFATSAEVFEVARASLERANAAIGDWFGTLPRAACEVVEMPRHEAEHSTVAYYRDPAADGSRPGQYYINTTHPETRPRYEAEALAFHESVPGHHLQLAIAQERDGLPAFRRFAGATSFVEGWGLYSERLADEMGLYSGDLDRLGIRSFDGWRACRLVVDTGIHALGWSRQRAIDFMADHTALAGNNIANEVDRYISMPGQALAYKVGQLELLRLRASASDALGPRFDIRTFHDIVLGEGALPLPVLGQVVERWVAGAT